ncbi:MAG: endonuclease/exonuclease/phosphatase family protein [Flavobacteriaceae bacterium]|nr:endonuclease/exonuclease/phosphatase family protein [Flavobacteriaceae bacterium]
MKIRIILALLLVSSIVKAQNKGTKYNIRTVAFYNVENLFDTIHNQKYDTDRTPNGKDHYTSKIYWDKINHIARVISEIGSAKAKNSPTIVGLSEIENRTVIQDLINSSYLKNKDYGIIHYDSPDERGVDVGLIYLKRYFKPVSHSSHTLYMYKPNGKRDYTRDQLLVSGILDGDLVHIIVNHWPSRSGGEMRSRPFRMAAAALNVKIIDSLQKTDSNAKIITMGDLNDDPISPSLKKVLKAKGKISALNPTDMYNPMEALFSKGLNTLAYRDNVNLFDQIILSEPFTKKDYSSYRFYQANIYNPSYLTNKEGRYKGYPFRSYSYNTYMGGYSDHFPVYIYLIKER